MLDQWEETLILAGIQHNRIKAYRYNDHHILGKNDDFILLTRYNLMSEMRNLLETRESNLFLSKDNNNGNNFPSIALLKKMENVYSSSHGKAANDVRHRGETACECIRRLLSASINASSNKNTKKLKLFRTFLVDEAHFLKNLESYWGMLTACLGAVSDKY